MVEQQSEQTEYIPSRQGLSEVTGIIQLTKRYRGSKMTHVGFYSVVLRGHLMQPAFMGIHLSRINRGRSQRSAGRQRSEVASIGRMVDGSVFPVSIRTNFTPTTRSTDSTRDGIGRSGWVRSLLSISIDVWRTVVCCEVIERKHDSLFISPSKARPLRPEDFRVER